MLILGLILGLVLQASSAWAADISCTSNGPGTNGWTTTVVDDHYKTTTQLSYCDEQGNVVGPVCSGITSMAGKVSCPRDYRCEKADFSGLGHCVQGAPLQTSCANSGIVGSPEGWTIQRSDASGFRSTVLSRCSDDGARVVGYSCTGNGWALQEVIASCPRGTFCQPNSRTGGGCASGTPASVQCVSQMPETFGWKWRITNANKSTTIFQAQCNTEGTALEGTICLNGLPAPYHLDCPTRATCSSGMCSPPAPPPQQQLALSITNYTAPIVQKDPRSGNQTLALVDGAKLISCLNSSGYRPQTRESGNGGFIQTILVYPDLRTPAATFQTCVQTAIVSGQDEWYFWKNGKIVGHYFGCTTEYANKDTSGRPIPWHPTKTAQIYFSGKQHGTDWTYGTGGGVTTPWFYASNDGRVNGVANGFTTTLNVPPINGYTMLSDTRWWIAIKTAPVYVSGKRLGTDWQNCTTVADAEAIAAWSEVKPASVNPVPTPVAEIETRESFSSRGPDVGSGNAEAPLAAVPADTLCPPERCYMEKDELVFKSVFGTEQRYPNMTREKFIELQLQRVSALKAMEKARNAGLEALRNYLLQTGLAVRGTPTAQAVESPREGGARYTTYTIAVSEVLRGKYDKPELTLVIPGGCVTRVDCETVWGLRTPKVNQEYVLFLNPLAKDQWGLMDLSESVYRVENNRLPDWDIDLSVVRERARAFASATTPITTPATAPVAVPTPTTIPVVSAPGTAPTRAPETAVVPEAPTAPARTPPMTPDLAPKPVQPSPRGGR